jgi:hypothetical protein
MTYVCNKPHTIYTNGGNKTKDITVEVDDHCGGKTTISVLNSEGTPIFTKTLSSPGDVALTIESGNEVHVACIGGDVLNPHNHCSVSYIESPD